MRAGISRNLNQLQNSQLKAENIQLNSLRDCRKHYFVFCGTTEEINIFLMKTKKTTKKKRKGAKNRRLRVVNS